jgi:hypothetical protein
VPSNRKRAKDKRSRLAAATVVIAIAVAIGFLAIRTSPRVLRPTLCVAGTGHDQLGLTVSQAAIAATIAGVASEREMPRRAVAIAYAAALQESKLANLNYGDQDSLGVFQQRPSEGWGTPRQIENPIYASGRFFAALAAVPGYLHMPIYKAAQAVQRSADGSAYGQYAAVGTELASAFSGTLPHAVWCSYGVPSSKAKLAAASRALSSTFGRLTSRVSGDPARTIRVRSARQGWAVAAWLVSHAVTYGITTVRFRGYEWLSNQGTGRWHRQQAEASATHAQARPRAASTAIVFG